MAWDYKAAGLGIYPGKGNDNPLQYLAGFAGCSPLCFKESDSTEHGCGLWFSGIHCL